MIWEDISVTVESSVVLKRGRDVTNWVTEPPATLVSQPSGLDRGRLHNAVRSDIARLTIDEYVTSTCPRRKKVIT